MASVKLFSYALLFVLAASANDVMARTLQDTYLRERHEKWMSEYGRVYADANEKEKRFQIFKNNVEFIESSNRAGSNSYRVDVNGFADLTNDEFRASRNGFKPSNKLKGDTSFTHANVTAPSNMDWRKKGAVTPIKDQGQCGKHHDN